MAIPLKANGTENIRDHSGVKNQKTVKNRPTQTLEHHTQKSSSEKNPSGDWIGFPSMSWIIPAIFLTLRNIWNGPSSRTIMDEILHVARP